MTNQPTGQPESNSNKLKNWIIAALALALIGSWVYMLMDQKDKQDTITRQQADITTLDASKLRLQEAFDESLTRLDSLGSFNDSLQGEIGGLKKDIDAKKAEIRKILKDRNAKQADLEKARLLIAELNDRILSLDAEVARLTGENKRLLTDNEQLKEDKNELERDINIIKDEKTALANEVDKGSTFVASNIQVQAVDVRRSGKERTTARAKRVDKLVVSFDVENRIAKSGPTKIHLIVIGPDGQVVKSDGIDQVFETKEEGQKACTAQLDVNYSQGTKQNVQFPISGSFEKGNYKIEIFQNGYRIGQADRPLK